MTPRYARLLASPLQQRVVVAHDAENPFHIDRQLTLSLVLPVQQAPGATVTMAGQRADDCLYLGYQGCMFDDAAFSARQRVVSAGEAVVPASELADALKQARELQRLLGKRTMEAEILKEAVEVTRSRKWIAHSPFLPGDAQ